MSVARNRTILGQYAALGFDNAQDMSNLLGLVLGAQPTVEPAPETPPATTFADVREKLEEKVIGPFRNIIIIVIGLILLIVALALLTR